MHDTTVCNQEVRIMNNFHIDDMTITAGIMIFATLICYIVALIRKARWIQVEAEVIDFHIVPIYPTSRVHRVPVGSQIYAITYRYFWNGEEQIASDHAMTTSFRLRRTKECLLYVKPKDGLSFVSPFVLRMWRNLTVFLFFLLLLYMLL